MDPSKLCHETCLLLICRTHIGWLYSLRLLLVDRIPTSSCCTLVVQEYIDLTNIPVKPLRHWRIIFLQIQHSICLFAPRDSLSLCRRWISSSVVVENCCHQGRDTRYIMHFWCSSDCKWLVVDRARYHHLLMIESYKDHDQSLLSQYQS